MQLLSALLVDNIVKHPDGRVDLIGLFEAIYFDKAPFILENLSIFVEIGIEPTDRGQPRALGVAVCDPGGVVVGEPTVARFVVPTELEYPRPVAQLDLALFNIPFDKWGPYRVRFAIDNVVVREIPLDVAARAS